MACELVGGSLLDSAGCQNLHSTVLLLRNAGEDDSHQLKSMIMARRQKSILCDGNGVFNSRSTNHLTCSLTERLWKRIDIRWTGIKIVERVLGEQGVPPLISGIRRVEGNPCKEECETICRLPHRSRTRFCELLSFQDFTFSYVKHLSTFNKLKGLMNTLNIRVKIVTPRREVTVSINGVARLAESATSERGRSGGNNRCQNSHSTNLDHWNVPDHRRAAQDWMKEMLSILREGTAIKRKR